MVNEAGPSEPLLDVRGVSKRFGNTLTLDNVSLSLSKGRIHALIGENGAGKSTLVKIISGVVQPDQGSIILEGAEVGFTSPSSASAAGITMVYQELALLPFNTVTENVFLGREWGGRAGLDWPAMKKATSNILQTLGVDLDPNTLVVELTTAQRQMVEIARAVRRKSRLLILDEPTAALPPDDAKRLFDVLRGLAGQGTAIVYISHRLDEIEALADDISVMKDGRRVTTVPASQLDADGMISLMVGRQLVDIFPARPASGRGLPLLAVQNLVDPPALRGVSFELAKGEVLGLYGLEGHGQDEVLTCLSGARPPLQGRLLIEGQPAEWRNVSGMIARGVGFVPEDRKSQGLALPMSGIHNIALPVLRKFSKWLLRSNTREETAARSAATLAGVKGDLEAQVSALSGGNQQKVLLARWLAAGSSVLLLNQPTRGVDVGSKAEIYALIRKTCAERHAGAVVVSREISELRGLCDRILVLCRGKLGGEHSPLDSEAMILATAVGRRPQRAA